MCFFWARVYINFFLGISGGEAVVVPEESQKNFAPFYSSANHWVTVASHRPRSMLMRVRMPMFRKMGAIRRRKTEPCKG